MVGKKVDGSSNNHGCKQILNYFRPAVVAKVAVPVPLDNNKENNMGGSSKQRGSGVKKKKRNGQAKALKEKQKLRPATKKQKTMEGGDAEGRADEGDDVCVACREIAKNPKWKQHAHHRTCKHNKFYHQTNGGQMTQMEWHLQEIDKLRKAEINKPFDRSELHTSTIKKTQAEVNNFITGRAGKRTPAESELLESNADTKPAAKEADEGIDPFSVDKLKKKINHFMKHPTPPMLNPKNSVPMVIGAAIETLLETQNIKAKKGSNELQLKTANPLKQYNLYRKQFPPGTLGFTFPRDDKMKQPDEHYSQAMKVLSTWIDCGGWRAGSAKVHKKCPKS